MAYFSTWLEDHGNRVIFEQGLLAQMSLLWEGMGRQITRDHVQQRMNLMKRMRSTIEFDPFRHADIGCFVQKWLARLSGAPPVGQVVKEEGASI